MDLNEIVKELVGETDRPSPAEAVVDPESVKTTAKRMLSRGYAPSERSLEAVRRYLQGYNLWLAGDVGTGKTAFFKAIDPKIRIFKMLDTLGWTVEAMKDWFEDNDRTDVVLDDIGSEPIFNYYGNRFEILPWIIEKRLGSRARTHLTGNLTAKATMERYGVRMIDRLRFFVKLDFKGDSRRKPRPFVKPLVNAV